MFKFAAVVGLFLLALPSSTQTTPDPGKARTAGFLNGRGWLTTSEGFRIGYISGAADALNMSCKTETKNSFSSALNINELVQALNKFYEEPTNVGVPVSYAMTIVKLQADGATAEVIEKYIEIGRRLAAQ